MVLFDAPCPNDISYNDDSISGASRNKVSLQEKNITHIFNWSHSVRCDLFDKIEYVCITDVRGNTGMRSHLADLDKYVDALDSIGGRVLSTGALLVWEKPQRYTSHRISYEIRRDDCGRSKRSNKRNPTPSKTLLGRPRRILAASGEAKRRQRSDKVVVAVFRVEAL